jgi:uncharacterized protein involved in outer membrane biogenesis
MRVVIDLPLPMRSITLRQLELSGARLHLVRDAEGRANWQARDPRTARRGNAPMIHGLAVTNTEVVLDDARRHLQFTGHVSAEQVTSSVGAPALKLSGAGRLNGRDATFEIVGDSLSTARRGKPYRFRLTERSEGAHLTGNGVLLQPFDIGVMDATFEAAGRSLRDITRMTGFAMPESDTFSLAGKLARRHERTTFTDLRARIGASDAGGTFMLATENGVRRVDADLHSSLLRLQDFGAHGAEASANVTTKKKLLFSDTPIPLGIVKNRVGKLNLRADRLAAGPLNISRFVAGATIHDGELEIPSVEWQLDDARFSGTMNVDTTGKTPATHIELSIAGLQASHLSRKNWKPAPFDGRLHARLRLDGEGDSLRQFASTVDGTVAAVLPRGTMRSSLAELTGVNLRGIGLALTNNSSETGVRCAVASFEGTDGVFKAQQLLIDTDAVLIEGGGTVDLRSESLDLTFRGALKQIRLGRARSPLHVRGALRSPSFSLEKGRLLAQTGGAALLGVALTPMAAVLALVDPGLAHDANCAELVRTSKGR